VDAARVPGRRPGERARRRVHLERAHRDARAGRYWGAGDSTRFAGYEGVPEGTIHFAGEHTSLEFQGYMEGAVRSGRRAAREIG